MKIGFSILSHQMPDSVFKRLLSQLEKYPNKHIAIHHDFNQAEFDQNIRQSSCLELVKNYVRTHWSHTNNIKAILETFKILYINNCDWYITLSAACYPIKSIPYTIDFLNNAQCDGFIERNNIDSDHFDFYKYFRKGFQTKYLGKIPFISKKGKLYQKAIRWPRNKTEILFDESFIAYHGSDWFIVNKTCIEYLLARSDEVDKLVNFLIEVNKGHDINVCPPEVVFQTILGNSQKFRLCHNNYRYIDWHNAVAWHPNLLTLRHLEEIKKSNALFARKFDYEQSKELIEFIDEHILDP